MSKIPSELYYTEEHEWVLIKDGVATVGITDYAQESLGDVVFVELPELETDLDSGSIVGVIESVKTASDLFAPVSGKVIEINEELAESPEILNKEPYTKGWIFKVQLSAEHSEDSFLTSEQYQKIVD